MAAFGWGYALSQVLVSMVAAKYGAKHAWLWLLSIATAVKMLVPFCSEVSGLYGACLARFIFDALQGSMFSVNMGIMLAWLHERERSTISTASGMLFAPIALSQAVITARLMDVVPWKWAFYLYTAIYCLWLYAWHHYDVDNDPRQCALCSLLAYLGSIRL